MSMLQNSLASLNGLAVGGTRLLQSPGWGVSGCPRGRDQRQVQSEGL